MEKPSYKEKVQQLLRKAEDNLPLPSVEHILEQLRNDDEAINHPCGPVQNPQSLASQYQMAATLLKASKHCGQAVFSHFFEMYLRLLKQVHFLKHGQELDGQPHGHIDPDIAMDVIKVFNWANTEASTFPSTSQVNSGANTAPSTSLSTSAVNPDSAKVPNASQTGHDPVRGNRSTLRQPRHASKGERKEDMGVQQAPLGLKAKTPWNDSLTSHRLTTSSSLYWTRSWRTTTRCQLCPRRQLRVCNGVCENSQPGDLWYANDTKQMSGDVTSHK